LNFVANLPAVSSVGGHPAPSNSPPPGCSVFLRLPFFLLLRSEMLSSPSRHSWRWPTQTRGPRFFFSGFFFHPGLSYNLTVLQDSFLSFSNWVRTTASQEMFPIFGPAVFSSILFFACSVVSSTLLTFHIFRSEVVVGA